MLKQPDLGTAIMLLLTGAALFFLAGVRLRMFALVAVAARGRGAGRLAISCATTRRTGSTPSSIPSSDPLGAGYHILQSKIALGSGGLFGKGFLARHPKPSELPAGKADRLHLHDDRRGVRL